MTDEPRWTDDTWVLDQIRAQMFATFEAMLEDNPEVIPELANGYPAGRLRIVFDREGARIEQLRGLLAVARPT